MNALLGVTIFTICVSLFGVPVAVIAESRENSYVSLIQLIEDVAVSERVDPLHLAVLVRQESGPNPDGCSVGRAGEIGLTQVMPAAKNEVVGWYYDLYNPRHSLIAGARYFKKQQNRASTLLLAFGAYNGGGVVLKGRVNHNVQRYMSSVSTLLKVAQDKGHWRYLFENTVIKNTNSQKCRV